MKTRYQLITEARLRTTAIHAAASQSMRRPGLRVVELTNGVADRNGCERLDDLMEAVDE